MRAVIVIVLLAILAITLATSPVRKPRGEGVSRRRHLSSSRPRGEKPSKAEKPRSRKPRSRKPKADEKPRSRKPLKEKIAGLEKKLAALKKKLAEKKDKKADKPKSRKPKSDKPKSRKPRSRKPKSDKPVKKTPKSKSPKSRSPKSRKPKSDKPAKSRKPRSDKPRSRKPKSDKPAKTMADAEFFDQVSQWWDKKGKNIFTEENVEKAKKAYDIFQQAKQLIQDKKQKAEDAEAPESDEGADDNIDEDGEDDESTVSCGQAYDHGTPLGEKQCVIVQGKPVVVETAAAFRKMEAAAKAAGITLHVNSGFRKMAEQEHLYNCHITKKCNNGNLAAKPGFSNHQNGKALDIEVSDNKVFTWMRNNASKFGFVRTVPTENWHFELRHTKCNAFVSYTCQ